jgi:putative addiction module killer protein
MVIEQTDGFSLWLRSLKDSKVRNRILARIDRLRFGNPGDVKSVGGGVSDMRIHHGPGYRAYFVQRGKTLAVLLAGGDKSTHDADIQTAIRLAAEY